MLVYFACPVLCNLWMTSHFFPHSLQSRLLVYLLIHSLCFFFFLTWIFVVICFNFVSVLLSLVLSLLIPFMLWLKTGLASFILKLNSISLYTYTYYILYIHILFIHLCIGGHLGCVMANLDC